MNEKSPMLTIEASEVITMVTKLVIVTVNISLTMKEFESEDNRYE